MNVNLIVKNLTRIKNGITIIVGVSVKIQKNIVSTKKITFEIQQHVFAKMVNIKEVSLTIQQLYAMNL